MAPRFSVSECIAALNQTLEYAFPMIEVEGEVSSFKVNQNKFVFFDLKDDEGKLGCFMTVFQLRIPLEDGMKIRVQATPKLTAWGKFSLTIKNVQPIGEGTIKKSFELLKAKLEKEGLFAPERKRQLPRFPSKIGVISSTQAAGYADFVKIVNQRFGGVDIEVAHVQVQGMAAPDQLKAAVEFFNQRPEPPDVLVLIRGGGSAEDLAAFNDEALVRAVAASRIPTLTGIGHEIDESLVDFVADVAAATPSNAAQIVVVDRESLRSEVRYELRSMSRNFEQAIDTERESITRLLEEAHETIERSVDETRSEISRLSQLLAGFNPERILARGYSILRGEIALGNEITIEQSTKLITAEVTHVENTK